jgi:hypothetical protein
VIGTLLTGVLAAGVGTLQARAGDAPEPGAHRSAQAASRPAPTPTPVRSVLRTAAPEPRPVVRFPQQLSAGWGIDVSWPQCESGIPAVPTGFAVIGANGGRPLTANPCLEQQVAAARARRLPVAAYLNLDAPGGVDAAAHARRVVDDGLARLGAAGLHVPVVWLDVEVLNDWPDRATNLAVIDAALARLRARGVIAGIYSSVPMWRLITGGATVSAPVWLAITGSEVPSLRQSSATGLGGNRATMVQYVAAAPGGRLVDADVLCRTDAGVLRLFARP